MSGAHNGEPSALDIYLIVCCSNREPKGSRDTAGTFGQVEEFLVEMKMSV